MTIRLRVFVLLALVALFSLGTFLFFHHIQETEERFAREQRLREVSARLDRLIRATSRPAARYLTDFSQRAGLAEFLVSRDVASIQKYFRGQLDSYGIDSAWILEANGSIDFGFDRVTDSVLTAFPLPAPERRQLLGQSRHFSFHTLWEGKLYQVQGMPILGPQREGPPAATLGWLVVAKEWNDSVLEGMADAGQGVVERTPPTRAGGTQSGMDLEAWQVLTDDRERPVAGLEYRVVGTVDEDQQQENVEFAVLIMNSLVTILVIGVALHFWILRPFSLIRQSVVVRDPALLNALVSQPDEIGRMARIIQSSMGDRDRLQQSLDDLTRLGRELHDGAIQGVYGAGMALSRVQSIIGQEFPTAHKLLEEVKTELNRVIADLRRQIGKADPQPMTYSFGEAVAQLIKLLYGPGPLTMCLDIDEGLVAAYSSLERSQLLQFVREVIGNALRHGHPSRITVSWNATSDGSVLAVLDDGLGFDPQSLRSGGRGLGNLSERAISLGGQLKIDSRPDIGTSVYLKLPSRKPA